MLRTLRRSMIAVFCSFVIFSLAWLFFFRMDDPLAEWEPIVRVHPEVNVAFWIILLAEVVAFLMLLVGGLPILFAAIRHAFVVRRRDVLTLFGITALMLLVFAVVAVFVLTNNWRFDPNGGIFGLISLSTVLVVTIALARAVMRSELSERVLHFALFPAIGVTIAIGVALVTTLVEAWFLAIDAPHSFSGTVTPNWVIADGMMVVALIVAIIALYGGLRTRTPSLA